MIPPVAVDDSKSKIKVLVVQRVCTHYRIPLFSRLSDLSNLKVLVCFGDGNRWTSPKIRTSKGKKTFPHTQLPTIAFSVGKRRFPIFYNPTLPLVTARFEPDIVVLEGESNLLNNMWLWPYLKLSKTPYVWWGLGDAPGRPSSVLRELFAPIVYNWLQGAAGVMAYSSHGAQNYISRGAMPERTHVVHNCLDTDRIALDIEKYAPQVDAARKRLKLEGKNTILFVGALERNKSVELLLRAFYKLRITRDDVTLLIVGDGSHRSALENWVSERQVEDIFFLGKHVQDVSLYFLLSDVFVLPGLGGLAINHAMAHGKPVIVSAADGTEKDQVIDGFNGYLIPPNDAGALAQAINKIVSSPNVARRMGKRSKELVERKFNMTKMVITFASVLMRIVSEGSMEDKYESGD